MFLDEYDLCLTIARTLLVYDFCLVRISTALTCNFRLNYADELNENIRNFLVVNLMNIVSVQLCKFLTQSHICRRQYMLLTHANDLLCLLLHTVGSQIFSRLLGLSFCSLSYILDWFVTTFVTHFTGPLYIFIQALLCKQQSFQQCFVDYIICAEILTMNSVLLPSI